MSLIAKRLGVALAIAAVAACGAQEEEPELMPAPQQQITLEVQNYNFNDATIDALGASGRQRIGRVPGNNRASFTFRWTSPDIALRITFLSQGQLETQSMPVTGGDVLELIIEQAIGIRPRLRRMR